MPSNARHLKPQQELFCQLYVRSERCFGNAARAYSDAYGLTEQQYPSALSSGARLLGNVCIRARINQLLDECLENKVVDRELARVILQNHDLGAKVAAIREYNRVRDRTSEKLEGSFTFSWKDSDA